MADRGYPYDSREAMFEQVNEEFSRRLEEITGGSLFDPFAEMSEEELEEFMAGRSEEEIADFVDLTRQDAMAGIDQDALEALQEEGSDNYSQFQSRTTLRTRTVTGNEKAYLLGWNDWEEEDEQYAVTRQTYESLRRFFRLDEGKGS